MSDTGTKSSSSDALYITGVVLIILVILIYLLLVVYITATLYSMNCIALFLISPILSLLCPVVFPAIILILLSTAVITPVHPVRLR